MVISKNLPDNRYTPLNVFTKKPLKQDWVNKPESKEQAEKYFKQGKNVGFLLGEGYICIDCDRFEVEQAVLSLLPETYMQRSGKRNLIQAFYKCPAVTDKITLSNHFGEVLSKGQQVVLSGSKYKITKEDLRKDPNLPYKEGTIVEYTTEKDLPIAEISFPQLMEVINHFSNSITESLEQERKTLSESIDELSITSILSTAGMEKDKKGQYYGSNPWHNSSTGSNFFINPTKNLAYCFRCGCAISPAKAIALNEGILNNCKNSLRGNDFLKAKEIAIQKYGLKQDTTQTKQVEETKEYEIKIMSWETLKDKKFNKGAYFLEKHCQPNKINMWCGPSNVGKSLICQTMAVNIATGKSFLNYFKTKKVNVLWCDKEDSEDELQNRFNMIRKGSNIRKINHLNVLDYECLGMLDSPKWLNALIKIIQQHNIKVIFFDTMHRFGSYVENSSDEINAFYLNCLQPLKNMGISINLIHHSTKSGDYRGSSDLKGMVDNYFSIKQDKSKKFVWINYEKVKNGPKLKSIAIEPIFLKSKANLKEADIFYLKSITKVNDAETPVAPKKVDILKQKIIDLGLRDKPRKEMIETLNKNNIKYSIASLDRIRKEFKGQTELITASNEENKDE